MSPCIHASREHLLSDELPGAGDDVRFSESLVEAVLERFTSVGDVVLDPFAGFGTTAVVAARMGRRTVAVEILPERAQLIRERVGDSATVVTGDVRQLARLVDGPFRLCLTSPPYMTAIEHPQNPMTGYATNDGDYATYLEELESVFSEVAGLLLPGGHLVVNVADVERHGVVTPLASDVAARVATHLEPVDVIPICWDAPPPGLVNDRCLVFRKPCD